MNPDDIKALVLVHGLWFRTGFMRLLISRLERAGLEVHPFNYRTTREPFAASAIRLVAHCRDRLPDAGHLIGHSLGGLLILSMLQRRDWEGAGRVLLLGTPLQGSLVARRTLGWPGGERLFGHAALPLLHGASAWPADREVGMIAGSRAFGLGVLAGGLPPPHDGTVTVAETRHPGLADHIALPVTHTSMLFSSAVARQAVRFLQTGRFEHQSAGGS